MRGGAANNLVGERRDRTRWVWDRGWVLFFSRKMRESENARLIQLLQWQPLRLTLV